MCILLDVAMVNFYLRQGEAVGSNNANINNAIINNANINPLTVTMGGGCVCGELIKSLG